MPRYCTSCKTVSTNHELLCDKCGKRMKTFQGFRTKKKSATATPVVSE